MILHLIGVGFLLATLAWPTDGWALESGSSRQLVNSSIGQLGRTPQTEARQDPSNRQLDHLIARPGEARPIPDYQFRVSPDERSLAWDAVRTVLTLAVVMLLLGLGVKVLRRWPGLAGREPVTGDLQVLERVALAPKEAICLVRVRADLLVVGVTPSGITLLHRLEAGVLEAMRAPSGADIPRGISRMSPSHASRLRGLAARIREVQTAWGLGGAPPRGKP